VADGGVARVKIRKEKGINLAAIKIIPNFSKEKAQYSKVMPLQSNKVDGRYGRCAVPPSLFKQSIFATPPKPIQTTSA